MLQIEWIENRLFGFDELLELNSCESALALGKRLGPMYPEAQHSNVGKPYCVIKLSFNSIAIPAQPSNSTVWTMAQIHSKSELVRMNFWTTENLQFQFDLIDSWSKICGGPAFKQY